MSKKVIMIILLVLTIFLFCIASVCASDAAMASEDNTGIETTDGELLSASDNNEIASAENDLDVLGDAESTYSDLSDQIGQLSSTNKNITLKHAYYKYNQGETISIGIADSVIDGNGSTIDMAGSTIRAFFVSASGVTIKNLTIKNANYNGDGGAIYFNSGASSGTVTNCNFTGNEARDNSFGGAIYMPSGTVTNCNFTGNKATDSNSCGGAIYMGLGTVENCNFTKNTAPNAGGAIFFSRSGSHTLTNCNFYDNKVTGTSGRGGAVYFNTHGDVTNCNFYDNKVTGTSGSGGAVYISNNGDVTNCNFTGNNATTGSAIYFKTPSNTKTVSNSIFLNNRANAESLGVTKNENSLTIIFTGNDNLLNAIYSRDGAQVSFTNVTYWGANGITNTGKVTTNPFGSNKEAGQIITVEIYDSNDNLVENVTYVTDDNGQVTYDFIKLSNGDYKYKAYHTQDGYYTYKEYNDTFTLESDLGDFNRLQKYINGAGENSVITLCRNYTFTIGSDENLAGGIVIDKQLTINGNGFTIDAKGKSRIFYVTAGSINITDVTLKNGKADHGGAIYFRNAISNSNINATYINNTANGQDYDDGGGANYFLQEVSGSNITGTYTNNIATNEGGANFFGGWISGSNIGGTYANNTATNGEGGANSFGDVSGSNITGTYANNTATNGEGGANYFFSVSDSKVTGTYANNAATDGGVNYFYDRVLNSDISGIYARNNATNGAIIYFYGNDLSLLTNVNIENAIFLNNKYDTNMGIIYARKTGVVAKNNWFGNNATNYETQPKTTNIQMDSWLFLNGTNNQNNIKFFLMSYDGTTTSGYDNTLLPKINLTVTTTDGIVDKSVVGLDETVKFSPTESGINRVTAQIEDAAQTIEFSMGDFNVLQGVINNASENSVINLTRNYTYNQYDTMTDGVLIDKNVTINGNGFTIDAKGKSRIFYVTAGSINITDVTLKNGKADHGGAIYFRNAISNSNINATYINNTANGQGFYDGGGANFIYSVSGSNVTGIYTNNTATNVGGANYIYSVSGSNINGIYTSNIATCGGANYIYSVSGSNINGTYTNNNATWGGAINFDYDVSGSNITGTYTNNTATYGGGANYIYSVSGSNINGTYTNNKAERYGGANYFLDRVSGSNVTGIYTGNDATNSGGANYFMNSVSGSNITGTYINNTASSGVIIYFEVFGQAILTNVTIENAIFLNNKYNENMGIIYAKKTGMVAKNNWFGNNATNYETQPKTTNIQMDSWLFLNATADPNSISVFDSSNILFKLYSTNGTHIYVYDNSKLPVVNLTLTANNGEVSNSTILDKSVEYVPTKVGQGSITASVEDAEYTIFLDNNKRDVNLSVAVNPQVIDYGENAAVILEYNATATGTVNITLTGKKHNQTIESVDLNKTITLPDNILPDEYEVIVSYSGDDVFANASAASSLTVNQLKSDIKVVGYDIYVNDTTGLMFSVTLPENATGNITLNNTITLNVTKEGRKENGSLIIEIMNDAYSVGQYNWTFTYSGDDIYENSQANAAANILIIPTEITANATSSLFVDDTGQVTYNVTPENAVGDVKFTSNDTSVVEVDQYGNIKAISEGTAIVTVTFEGCENYTASSTNVTVTVSKIATEITLTNTTVELKAHENISDLAKLDPAGAGNLTYSSSDEDIVLVSEDGIIYARIKGTATVTVSFAGDNKYKSAENKTITVTVTLNDASVSTENDTMDLYVDDTCIINATANPRFLTVYYASSNESVATVTEYGNVKAVGEGTAIITLTVGNGETYAINSTNVTVTVSKVPTEITVNTASLDLFVGDETIINATLTPAGAGNVTFISSDYDVVDFDDEGNVIAQGKGQAIITVSFAGDNKYAAAENKTITVTVSLNDASVTVDNDTLDLKVGETYKINATKNPDTILLDIAYSSSNSSVVSVDENGIVTAVGEGTATITVEVGDDVIYAKNSTNITVTVSKILTEIIVQNATVDMKVTDEVTPVVSLMPSDAGELDFTSSDVSVVTVDGIGTITAVGEGIANVTIRFIGNDKYAAAESKNITVTVNKQDANASVSIPENVTVGDNSTINVKLPSDATGTVTVKVDGEVVDTVQVTGGSADVTIPSLSAGNHTVEIAYSGDGKYNPSNETKEITVSKKDTTPEITIPSDITVGDDSNIEITLPSDATGNITLKVDGEIVDTVPVADGSANLTLPSLSAGNHTVEIAYSGDEKYNPVSATKDITVSKKETTPEIAVEGSNVDVKLPADATGNVTVKVDGEVIDTVPVTDGTASVKLPKLSAGNHTVEIDYSGDDKYNPSTETVIVAEDRESTKLTANNVTATYKVKKYLTITLTDSQGSPIANATVSVKLKSAKNYTTDENGKIKVKVSNLVPKTYTAKITFKGDDNYIGSNITSKVTVKKATAKITAKAKTFKSTTKNKKYTVTLKANGKALKNKWVYLKVNGKKYKAKTNSKGKATFKITQLNKAGKFKATVTFKGNDYYKKATKKATIKVKSVWKTVQKGSKNSAIVKKIQRALKNHGYYLEYNGHYLMVDGIFWDYTEMAVKEFQNDKTLKVTGKVDEKTAKKLGII